MGEKDAKDLLRKYKLQKGARRGKRGSEEKLGKHVTIHVIHFGSLKTQVFSTSFKTDSQTTT